MAVYIGALAAGLILVVVGGHLFVDSSVVIAKRLGLPRMVVGGTIVSIATTTPELVVSMTASYVGDSGIAMGNAVGSAITNIGLIVGIVGLLTEVRIDLTEFKVAWTWMFLSAVLVILVSWRLQTTRGAGLMLVGVSMAYLAFDSFRMKTGKRPLPVDAGEETTGTKAGLWFLVGAALVIGGSRLLVRSGIAVAAVLGIPSVVIGLSVIAVGTSLPELVTGIISARRGVPDLSVGNIVGANVLNLALIVGASSMIHPLNITPFTRAYSFPWLMVFIVALAWGLRRDGRLSTGVGALLLALYGLYIAGLVVWPALGIE